MSDQNQSQSNPPVAPETPVSPPSPKSEPPEGNIARGQPLPIFEQEFLKVIALHRRHFDMTDERFMIALLGFLQSWVQLPGVRARAAADLALARQAASADLKRDDKTLSDGEAVDAVVSSIMAVRII